MWQPTASFENLKKRAEIINAIRHFFQQRGLLEVETPLLSQATVTDVHLQSFATHYYANLNSTPKTFYLQTSPEYAMKRLLAAGSGPIFQITKAFRNDGEMGKQHNPEFTILEWYRPGFNHLDLMQEMDELLQFVLQTKPAQYITYAEAFSNTLDLNPHIATINELKNCAQQFGLIETDELNLENRDDWLHLLMSHFIEPKLGCNHQPTFIYDFPASQAALARIRQDHPPVAERFEVYIAGIELANGFHELADPDEQRHRFVDNLHQRIQQRLPAVPMDENFLAALEHGLPDCAGVALGVDRLIMLATKANNIADVIGFPAERC